MKRATQIIEKAKMAKPSLWILALLALGFMALLSTPATAQQPEVKPPVFEELETDEKTGNTIVINVFPEVKNGKSTGSIEGIQVDDKPKLLQGEDGQFDWQAFGKLFAEIKKAKEKAKAEAGGEETLAVILKVDSRVHYKDASKIMKIIVKHGARKVNLVATTE